MSRIIGHLDMDAFFAAVEERERPYLKGAPIAVGADPAGGTGRGVVSTANYAARAYGIKSATPIRHAWEMSEKAREAGKPPVVFLSVHFEKYREVSKRIMKIVARHLEKRSVSLFETEPPSLEQVSPNNFCEAKLERASVDECFFELSFAGTSEKAKKIAEQIKKAIQKEEKLLCSIGIGSNKLIAKIASDFEKPDGLTVVRQEEAERFLSPLSVRKIPGVGPKAEARFAHLGVRTVSDAKKLSEEKLRGLFGKFGSELYRKFRGEDDSPVVTEAPPAKSIGGQETLPEDSLDMKILLQYLDRQAREIAARVKKDGFKSFRTIVLTVRFADFETVSRSRTLKEPIVVGRSQTPPKGSLTTTADAVVLLARHATQMFFPFLDRRENPQRKKIRLIGIRAEKLK